MLPDSILIGPGAFLDMCASSIEAYNCECVGFLTGAVRRKAPPQRRLRIRSAYPQQFIARRPSSAEESNAAAGVRTREVLRALSYMRGVALVGAMRAGREESGIVGARPDERDLERRIRCPGCGGTMMTHYYAGPGNVVIDNCPGCRLNWLDHRELRRIVEGSGGEDGDEAWRMPG